MRHDDLLPRSHRAVSLQVAPFLRDCDVVEPAKPNGKRVSFSHLI